MKWLVPIVVVVLRVLIPALARQAEPVSEDSRPSAALKDRLRRRVRAYVGRGGDRWRLSSRAGARTARSTCLTATPSGSVRPSSARRSGSWGRTAGLLPGGWTFPRAGTSCPIPVTQATNRMAGRERFPSHDAHPSSNLARWLQLPRYWEWPKPLPASIIPAVKIILIRWFIDTSMETEDLQRGQNPNQGVAGDTRQVTDPLAKR